MTDPPLVLFLRYGPGGGLVEPDVVHLTDPGPDGKPVIEEDGIPLRCGGWWATIAIQWGAENPEGLPVPGPDYAEPDRRMRLCQQCVDSSKPPIPPPPPVTSGP